jgi:hypothetical protein
MTTVAPQFAAFDRMEEQHELVFSPALSDFQCRTIAAISVLPDFAHFVTTSERFADPEFGTGKRLFVLYYDKAVPPRLHAVQIGKVRVIREVISE